MYWASVQLSLIAILVGRKIVESNGRPHFLDPKAAHNHADNSQRIGAFFYPEAHLIW